MNPCPLCQGCGNIQPKPRRDKRWIVSMIEMGRANGLTLAQIAQSIGMSTSTVEKYCARLGIRKGP